MRGVTCGPNVASSCRCVAPQLVGACAGCSGHAGTRAGCGGAREGAPATARTVVIWVLWWLEYTSAAQLTLKAEPPMPLTCRDGPACIRCMHNTPPGCCAPGRCWFLRPACQMPATTTALRLTPPCVAAAHVPEHPHLCTLHISLLGLSWRVHAARQHIHDLQPPQRKLNVKTCFQQQQCQCAARLPDCPTLAKKPCAPPPLRLRRCLPRPLAPSLPRSLGQPRHPPSRRGCRGWRAGRAGPGGP